MQAFELADAFASQVLDDRHRALRLRLGARGQFDRVLLIQSIDIHETLCGGIDGHVTCLSTRPDLPLSTFEGLPVEVQIVTDRGRLRRICAIVRQVCRGQSDGALTVYQLGIVDALTLLEQRIRTRVFRGKSVVDITRVVLDETRRNAPSFGILFDYHLQLDEDRYPRREFVLQAGESVAGFLRRHWARAGISWFIRPAAAESDLPRHELVLFDDAMRLDENAAGVVRYHRLDAPEKRDGIIAWVEKRQLVCGGIHRSSWDYKTTHVAQAWDTTTRDHGVDGNDFVDYLEDTSIEMPHAGNSGNDFDRLTRLRARHHEQERERVYGISGIRDIAVGEHNRIDGHPVLDRRPPLEREYVFIDVHHRAENNLKSLDARARALLESSEQSAGWVAASPVPARPADDARQPDGKPRYLNRFVAVRRGQPLVAALREPPRMKPMTARVVGPEGETVHTDALGRVKVQFLGLDPADHVHASGVGTRGTDVDSAWLRTNMLCAGGDQGLLFPLRTGMEVTVDFHGGDPDRPFISQVNYNGANPPPHFSHGEGLPNDRYLSGIKSKEIGANRYGQLVFDDTPGQISVRVASEHGDSRLDLGDLRALRRNSGAAPRGEGFELRTNDSGTIRTAKSLLVSAWGRLNAGTGQLSAEEHLALMQDCLELFKTLGHYAMNHQSLPFDDQPQSRLKDDLKAAPGGSNVDPKAEGGAPSISITAPAGIALTTPQTLISYAGVNIDTVAQQHLQFTAGQRFNLNAGQGVGLFSHHGGLNAIAHHGGLLLQSQHDETRIESAKDIVLSAQGSIKLMAKDIQLISEDGSFIKIDASVLLGSKGSIASKGSSFPHSGPASMGAELPAFSNAPADQRFVLRYGGPDAAPAANRKYEATLSDGSVVTGVSDADGKTELLQREAMHLANIRVLRD